MPPTQRPTWQLFALAVLIWGTTWHAIVYQLAQASPEFGVALRFGVAGALVLAWSAWRGQSLRCPPRAHLLLALQGGFMYSLSYLCVYHAERHVPSGLVAIGYSASPLVNGLVAWRLWNGPMSRRFLVGGAMGMAGVAVIFWPELAQVQRDGAARLGALFTVGAVLLSSVGALAASRNRATGLPFWPALGWGMAWGAAVSFVFVAATGGWPAWPTAPSWWISLLYLAVAGSIVAFACYLALQERIGPGAAASVGVVTPVLALVVSALAEGYEPSAFTLAGVVLALAGNAAMLAPQARRAAR